jgi:hypothetical protein
MTFGLPSVLDGDFVYESNKTAHTMTTNDIMRMSQYSDLAIGLSDRLKGIENF